MSENDISQAEMEKVYAKYREEISLKQENYMKRRLEETKRMVKRTGCTRRTDTRGRRKVIEENKAEVEFRDMLEKLLYPDGYFLSSCLPKPWIATSEFVIHGIVEQK